MPRTPPLAVLQGYGGRVTKRVVKNTPEEGEERVREVAPILVGDVDALISRYVDSKYSFFFFLKIQIVR